MQYNYSFEIAALIMMSFVAFVFVLNYDFELAKNRSYFAFLMACVLESVMNIASCIGLSRTDIVSNTANDLICFTFFMTEAFASIWFFRYVVNICVASRKRRILLARLSMIPFGFFMFLILSNPFLHLIYQLEDNVYSQGPMAWFGYFYIILFLICGLVVAITAKSTIRGRNRYAVVAGSLISILGIGFQFVFKSILLTGFSNAAALSMFYIIVQASNELKDSVSNVSNDRAFFLHYENALNTEKPMQILLVDIYQSARISVKYGYRNGKALLGEIGDFLKGIAGQNHVFHISSNVFAITLPMQVDSDEIRGKIFGRFDEPWTVNQTEVLAPVKILKIRCPEDAGSVKDFYALSEYAKSLLRKDTVHYYMEITPEIRENYLRQSKVELAVSRAIENKSLQVYFQPIYDNEKKAFTSLEALSRLIDEEIGFVPPDEFIEVAENNGAIVQLDLLVLEKCCKFIAEEILPRKDELQIETVQINASAVGCMQQNMDEIVLAIIDKYQVPHDMIMIELTERVGVSAAEIMEKHMRSLKEEGISFALDDYGTGNSNCSYLIEYPFDKVKFDKTMVWASFSSDTAKIILNGEIETIKKLQIPIVAEGIETEEQLSEMSKLGVKGIQGYYYSKPLPQDELIAFLTK